MNSSSEYKSVKLNPFIIIVATDEKNGIGKDNRVVWHYPEDLKFFKEKTIMSIIIMGRKTFESIGRCLPDRITFVISSNLQQPSDSKYYVFKSLRDALQSSSNFLFKDIYVIGGEMLYKEAMENYLYLCKNIYITSVKGDYNCDRFFPNYEHIKNTLKDTKILSDNCVVRKYEPSIRHDEYQYLDIMREILENGDEKSDRTNTGTLSLSGVHMKFDISDRIPFLTTKKVLWDKVLIELLWFISGSTDVSILKKQGVNFWDGNTSREFLDKHNLHHLEENDLGEGYGFQWRHWGASYKGCKANYEGKGIDQLANVVEMLKEDPFSRRIIMTAWNPSSLENVALPPCHSFIQWTVAEVNYKKCFNACECERCKNLPEYSTIQYLDCILTQRSGDMFLGVPFNIASYSILTWMLAHIISTFYAENCCGVLMKPRYFIHNIGDAHIYKTHIEAVNKQLSNTPLPFPRLKINSRIEDINNFKFEDFSVEDYQYAPFIKAPMAV